MSPFTIQTRLMISGIVVLSWSPVVFSASLPFRELLPQMRAAQDAVDRAECEFVTHRQYYGTETVECGSGVRHLDVSQDPAAWPPVEVRQYHITFDGERFRRSRTVQGPSGPLLNEYVWDGVRLIGREAGKNFVGLDSNPGLYAGGIEDPRAFAYLPKPLESMLDRLVRSDAAGLVSVEEAQLNDRPALFINAQADASGLGYRLWIDPASFLPIQIEWVKDGVVAYRYYDIKHHQMPNGVFFPVEGKLDLFPFSCALHRQQPTSTTHMTVDPASINLSPDLGPATFTLQIPQGTEIHDYTSGERQVYIASASANAEETAIASINEAKGMMSSHDPKPESLVATSGGLGIGTALLALALSGFVAAWFVSRSRSGG